MKRLFIVLYLTFKITFVYAHLAPLDNNGGHKVSEEWIYEGKYIEMTNGLQENLTGKIFFEKGDYHFHCFTCSRGMNDGYVQNGIYLPMPKSVYLFDNEWRLE